MGGCIGKRVCVAATAIMVVASAWSGALARRSSAHAEGLVERVRALERAVIHGDFVNLREQARWLSEHVEPSPMPVEAQPSADRIKERLAVLARATDVGVAASEAADISVSCGSCHETAKVTPVFPRDTPSAFGSIAGHMVRHQMASDFMLEGLVVPSSRAWTTGAQQLAEAPLKHGDFPVSQRIGALMSEVETRLHAQAREAMTAVDAPARGRAYGALLTTCAGCHTRHTTLWEAPPR